MSRGHHNARSRQRDFTPRGDNSFGPKCRSVARRGSLIGKRRTRRGRVRLDTRRPCLGAVVRRRHEQEPIEPPCQFSHGIVSTAQGNLLDVPRWSAPRPEARIGSVALPLPIPLWRGRAIHNIMPTYVVSLPWGVIPQYKFGDDRSGQGIPQSLPCFSVSVVLGVQEKGGSRVPHDPTF